MTDRKSTCIRVDERDVVADELRVDRDPTPEASWDDVRRVAMLVKERLGAGKPPAAGLRPGRRSSGPRP